MFYLFYGDRRAFELEEDISRARTGAPTSLAFHDMGLSTIVRLAHAAGGRGSILYRKCAYYGYIIIASGGGRTLDHGLRLCVCLPHIGRI
jgi:hypothetical protein